MVLWFFSSPTGRCLSQRSNVGVRASALALLVRKTKPNPKKPMAWRCDCTSIHHNLALCPKPRLSLRSAGLRADGLNLQGRNHDSYARRTTAGKAPFIDWACGAASGANPSAAGSGASFRASACHSRGRSRRSRCCCRPRARSLQVPGPSLDGEDGPPGPVAPGATRRRRHCVLESLARADRGCALHRQDGPPDSTDAHHTSASEAPLDASYCHTRGLGLG
ncbi:hypothetical protein D3C85_963110 [compost metagenome]